MSLSDVAKEVLDIERKDTEYVSLSRSSAREGSRYITVQALY